MKKRDLTLERKIGICVLGLFVFLAISCGQDVLAMDAEEEVTGDPIAMTGDALNAVVLNVKATSVTVPLDANTNRIFYSPYNATTFVPTGASVTAAATGWTEKAVYSGASPDVKITVLNKVAGDLIVKVDFIMATTTGAISSSTSSPSALTIASKWLKYNNTGEFGSNPVVAMMSKGGVTTITSGGGITHVTIDPATLSTLILNDTSILPANTTQTLYSFTSGFKTSAHIIFTAVLVNSATAANPQVLGVDVQSIFFNYIPTSATGWYNTRSTATDAYTPIWLDLIQAYPLPH